VLSNKKPARLRKLKVTDEVGMELSAVSGVSSGTCE